MVVSRGQMAGIHEMRVHIICVHCLTVGGRW